MNFEVLSQILDAYHSFVRDDSDADHQDQPQNLENKRVNSHFEQQNLYSISNEFFLSRGVKNDVWS